MSLATEKKTGVVAQFQRATNDPARPSTDRLLSERINASANTLARTSAITPPPRPREAGQQRRKLLDYLKATPAKYQKWSSVWVSGANTRTRRPRLKARPSSFSRQ